jgi:hypothetical protein
LAGFSEAGFLSRQLLRVAFGRLRAANPTDAAGVTVSP